MDASDNDLLNTISELKGQMREIVKTLIALEAQVKGDKLKESPTDTAHSDAPQASAESSEYDNITISADMIQNSNILSSLESLMVECGQVRANARAAITQRLEKTKVLDRAPQALTFNQGARDLEVLLEKKNKILDNLEIAFKTCITELNKDAPNTTPLLNTLDEIYAYDEQLYKINKAARTPAHKGPYVDLIHKSSQLILDFIQQAITHEQESKPKN